MELSDDDIKRLHDYLDMVSDAFYAGNEGVFVKYESKIREGLGGC